MWLLKLMFASSEIAGTGEGWDRTARARALSVLCSSSAPGGEAESDGEGRLSRLRGLGWATTRSDRREIVDHASA